MHYPTSGTTIECAFCNACLYFGGKNISDAQLAQNGWTQENWVWGSHAVGPIYACPLHIADLAVVDPNKSSKQVTRKFVHTGGMFSDHPSDRNILDDLWIIVTNLQHRLCQRPRRKPFMARSI